MIQANGITVYLCILEILLLWIGTSYPLISFHQKYYYSNKYEVLEKFRYFYVIVNIILSLICIGTEDFRITLYATVIMTVVYWISLKVLSYFVKKKELKYY